VYVQQLIEVLGAAHLSHLVEQRQFPERGGIMLVGAPGVLKSTFLMELDKQYPDAISISDLNAKALTVLRDQIATGQINTLIFPELQKLYERRDDTASNLEGTLRALVSEGFQAASFEDQRVNRIAARCMVMGAMTTSTQERRFERWEESGFNRRFLWCLFRLRNPQALDNAVIEWQRIQFKVSKLPQVPPFSSGIPSIPNLTSRDERHRMRILVKHQPGGAHNQQAQLLIKILAVLKWWYRETGDVRCAQETVEAFAVGLSDSGAELELEPLPTPSARTLRRLRERKRREEITVAAQLLASRARRPVKKAAPRRAR
jgi:hypothetical protein